MVKPPNWIYTQSAILPYRQQGGDLEVLVITSRKGTRWVLPKGIVEPGMTAAASAAKEAKEEAGVEGKVVEQSLGKYEHKKWGGTCEVEVFPMAVTGELNEWPERAFRRREWVSLAEAAKRLDRDQLRKILRRLPDEIEQLAKGNRAWAAIGEPPRLIYLFRHAKSSWDDPLLADFDRPLAPRGRHAGETMGQYMRLADVQPDVILCSSAARARETLERVLPGLDEDVPVRYEKALYHGAAAVLMDRLRRVPDKVNAVLMIGHNPAMHALAVGLAGAGDAEAMARLEAKFPTAGLVTLVLKRSRWRDLGPEACELHSFVVPRELA